MGKKRGKPYKWLLIILMTISSGYMVRAYSILIDILEVFPSNYCGQPHEKVDNG